MELERGHNLMDMMGKDGLLECPLRSLLCWTDCRQGWECRGYQELLAVFIQAAD